MESFSFYCRKCREYFLKIDTRRVRIQDAGHISYCLKCDSELMRVCKTCKENGVMMFSEKRVGGDFLDGYRLRFCSVCGASFPLYNMLSCRNNDDYSNRAIRNALHAVLTHLGMSYDLKVTLFDEIKQNCTTNYEIIDFIAEKTHATQRFVLDNFVK